VFQSIAERNKPTAVDTSAMATGVAQSVKDAQAEADKYVEKTAYKGVNDKQIKKAASGDDKAFQEIANLFAAPDAQAGNLDLSVDTTYSDLDKLDSRVGVAELIGKQAGKDYDPRLGKFDAALTMSDAGFQKTREDLDKQAEKARTSIGEIDTKAEATAQAKLTEQQKKAKKAALDQIRSSLLAEQKEAEAARAAEIAARQGLAGDNDFVTREKLAAQSELLEADPSLMQYMLESNPYFKQVDPRSFYNVNMDPGALGAFYDKGDVATFNRLNDLLGLGGGKRMAEISGDKTAAQAFDKGAYQRAVTAAIESMRRDEANKAAAGARGGGGSAKAPSPATDLIKKLDPRKVEKDPRKWRP
jgi:hypothetical protein